MRARRPVRRVVAGIAAAFVLLGCAADEVMAPASTIIAADIDGTAFVAYAKSTEFSLYENGTRLLIAGVEVTGDQSRQVAIDLGGWRGVGSYSIDSEDALGSVVESGPLADGPPTGPISRRWETKSSGDVGELVITEFDLARRHIAGTFRFRAENATGNLIDVMNGTFDGTLVIDP